MASAIVAAIAATWTAGFGARRGFPLVPASGRLGCIDGLRGYLALAVLAHHFAIWVDVSRFGAEWTQPPNDILEGFGRDGVALFFATTGFVFYPRILAGFLKADWVRIYIGRLFRILPMTIASIMLVLLFIVANGRAVERPSLSALLVWISGYDKPPLLGFEESYRVNAGVLWSIWYEWVFYLLILPVLAVGTNVAEAIGLRRLHGLVAGGFLMVALALQHTYGVGRLSVFLPMFAVGMLAYELRGWEAIRRILAHPAMTPVALGALGARLALGSAVPGYVAVGLDGLFFACVACGNSLFGALMTKGARVLGECSFSIYLMHGLVLATFFITGARMAAMIDLDLLPLAMIPLAIVLAAVTMATFLWIERPMIHVGGKVGAWWSGRRGALTIAEREVAP